MADDNYLTMARIMKSEWEKWEKQYVWGKGHTGFGEILAHDAFRDGFMAGFAARFFNNEGE